MSKRRPTKQTRPRRPTSQTVEAVAFRRHRLIVVPINDILPNPVQPEERTRECALSVLKQKAIFTRRLVPVVVEPIKGSHQYVLLDGGRRCEVAKACAQTEIECLVTVDERYDNERRLFGNLNTGIRPLRGSDWLASWSKNNTKQQRDAYLRDMPKATAARIRRIIEIVSEETLLELVTTDPTITPKAVDYVFMLDSMLRQRQFCYEHKRIAVWTLKHHMGSHIRHVNDFYGMKLIRNLQRITACIEADRPFKLT